MVQPYWMIRWKPHDDNGAGTRYRRNLGSREVKGSFFVTETTNCTQYLFSISSVF